MTKRLRSAALAASVWLALPLACGADSGHAPTDGHAAEAGHGGHAAPAPKIGSLAGAWKSLMALRDAIAGDVESGRLGEVHARAEALPGRVAALLELSRDLDAGGRARVEGAAEQVERIADALHVSADRGDAARTRTQLSRLDGLLQLIRVQYPAGALDARSGGLEDRSSAPGHDHEAHAHPERPAGAVDAPPQATVRIRAVDALRFEPRRIQVQAGVPTRIVLENVGAAEHSLVVKTPDAARDWVHLHAAPGATDAATFRLDQPGTYPVLCTISGHTEGGMAGELVVLGGSQPAHSHP